ncbi:MAG TPA: IS110 family transposase [Verrucomicrobiae bacterium]|jgi:transposase|nr:IS110 family transposase [Verrucomicrobiae bacterium]
MKRKAANSKKTKKKISVNDGWELISPNAAGIDIGSKEHWACVPANGDRKSIRAFGTFTADLNTLADWFEQCGITTVAMEATGVYWVPCFQILEARGFQVVLVNSRQTKNVAGRKSDCKDCQWIQRLHSYGLLQASFRPADPYCQLRSYLRYRDELVGARSTQCQHMQKALQEMNVQLAQVLSDITGTSGLAILQAILEGERDPDKLVALLDRRVRATPHAVKKALEGNYRQEHLFVLKSAFELYHTYEEKIRACDQEILVETAKLPEKVELAAKPLPPRKEGRPAAKDKMLGKDLREELYRRLGVDLTAIEGIGIMTGLVFLTEVGPDLSRFPSEKHFASWLGLCPDNRISGGKVLSSHTRKVINRVSDALRLAATSLERSQSALGAFYRRMKARLGNAEAVTATAHKLARLIYRLVKHGEAYVRQGMADYERKHQEQRQRGLKKAAAAMGFQLVPLQSLPT